MINLSLDRFRRVNYNLEKQEPEMNNSYSYKTVHQLPSTFTAQLYSISLAVKGMHDWGDRCEIKVAFHKTEISRRGFHFSRTILTALRAALRSISYFKGLLCTVYHTWAPEGMAINRRYSKQGERGFLTKVTKPMRVSKTKASTWNSGIIAKL